MLNVKSNSLRLFVEEIQYRNRNPRDLLVLNLLDDLSTNTEILVQKNCNLYRARIINHADIQTKINQEPNFFWVRMPRELCSAKRADKRFSRELSLYPLFILRKSPLYCIGGSQTSARRDGQYCNDNSNRQYSIVRFYVAKETEEYVNGKTASF